MSEEVQQQAAPAEAPAEATKLNALVTNLPVPGYPYPLRVQVVLTPEMDAEFEKMTPEEKKVAVTNVVINMFAESVAYLTGGTPQPQPQQQGPRRTEGGLILP